VQVVRALVLWANPQSPNLGVRALGEGAAAVLTRADPAIEISWAGYGASGAPVPLGHWRPVARDLLPRQGRLEEWLARFDVVLDMRDGDSFADIYGFRRLATICLVAEHAHRAGVPLVLGPQTIGPFTTPWSRLLARRSLETAALVMVRDPGSAEQAERLGRLPDVRSTDVVFALPVPDRVAWRDVVLNVSGLLWNSAAHGDPVHYRRTMVEVFRRLVSAGRTVSLLCHVLGGDTVDNDVSAAHELLTMVGVDAEVVEPLGLTEARQLLRGADLVVGSRMHACLNALSVGTPAIALAYSRKFEPLLHDLGWTHVVPVTAGHVADEVAAFAAGDHRAEARQVRLRAADRVSAAVHALQSVTA
jgi:polysaccharide pyruvyl transferase WcaK-like protein